jgi:hypothetical protein
MKKLFCILVFVFPFVAFAQNQQPAANSMESVRNMMGITKRTTTGIHHEKYSGQFFKPQTPDKGSLIQIFDSVYLWQLDTSNNEWNIYLRTIKMAYDINNNLTFCKTQNWNGSAWVNNYQYTYTYDDHNNQTSKIYQSWNGSAWVNYDQYTYTYDDHNNQTSEIYQSWNGSNWMNVEEHINTYNVNNDLTGVSDEQWNGSAWVNYYQYIYTFDAKNNQTRELSQSWSNNTWVNMWQNISTYNAGNKLTNGLSQTWNGSVWENSTLSTYTYDANTNLISEIEQSWNGTAWVNYYQYTYTYDASNNQATELSQFWWNNVWANSWEQFSSYDANNFRKSIVNINWDITGTVVTGSDSTYYYFHTVLGINDLKLQDTGITIYPNPALTQITIGTPTTTAKNQLSIINLNGQEVLTCQITQPKTQIDISTLPVGVYFIRVANDKTVEVGRFVKE